jgi:uncharacterized damage-inducible protein DinB
VADPTVEAARDVLSEGLDDLLAALEDIEVERLNRKPFGEGSNSLAVIVTHALASTRSWMSLAIGAELPPRDRPAEFAMVADDGFVVFAHALADECRRLLTDDVAWDPARVGFAPWRTDGADEPVTAAWALHHAIAHLHEHVGHAQAAHDLFTTI